MMYNAGMESQAAGFEIRVCTREGCGLRFPLEKATATDVRCPRCRAETRLALSWEGQSPGVETRPSSLHIEGFLDNIRSAWNVGAMFRTADGLGVSRLHLAGTTPTPENPKVLKTSLGAERWIAWNWAADGLKAALELKSSGKILWGLELDHRAIPLDLIDRPLTRQEIVLVVGNERSGIDPGILQLCDQIVALPMSGGKGSFNVAIAFAIAAFHLSHR